MIKGKDHFVESIYRLEIYHNNIPSDPTEYHAKYEFLYLIKPEKLHQFLVNLKPV